MTNIVTWIFKFREIVIILTCYMSLADAQCSQDINGLYRFGSECGFICNCLNNVQCDVSTGECPSGCDFEWVGPGCQHNNIALRQIARHADNLPAPNYRFATLAIDRDLSTCSFTGYENTTGRTVNPFWRVWMPYNFTLRRMEILTLDSKRKYFDGLKVLVEYVPKANKHDQNYKPDLSQICYTHSNTSLESVSLTVTCDKAYSGNQVKLQLGRRDTQLVLCDVRIYGECAENVCTHDCNKLCFCKDVTANDKVSGTCTNGCTGRWSGRDGACDKECATDKWGATCDTQCGYCRNNASCDAVTGKCPSGCRAGYKDTQKCDTECDDGTYGQNCQSNCTGHCKNNVPCRKTYGHCPDGCVPGYTGEKCSESCSLGYYGNYCTQTCSAFCNGGLSSCSHVDGICLHGCLSGYERQLCNHECEPGKWGVNCTSQCGMCLTGTCNHINGICMDGTGCKAGYIFHPGCNQECQNGTFGMNCTKNCSKNCNQVCDKVSGACASCKAGWKGMYCNMACEDETYGVNCSLQCGRCTTDSVCNKTTGVCHEGCSKGFKGDMCIHIEECNDGTYGQDCQSNCTGRCKNNVPCRKTDGHCPDGCAPGYTGEKCSKLCPIGYHGYDCKEKCSANCAYGQVDCDKEYGTCLVGCNPGWTGRTCQQEIKEETTAASTAATTAVIAVIAGVGAAILIVIILGVLAILWYLRRTRNSSNVEKQNNRTHRGMAMSNVNMSSKGAEMKPIDKSGDTYDTLQGGNADEHQYELTDLKHN